MNSIPTDDPFASHVLLTVDMWTAVPLPCLSILSIGMQKRKWSIKTAASAFLDRIASNRITTFWKKKPVAVRFHNYISMEILKEKGQQPQRGLKVAVWTSS